MMLCTSHGYCDKCEKLVEVKKDRLEAITGSDLILARCPEHDHALMPVNVNMDHALVFNK